MESVKESLSALADLFNSKMTSFQSELQKTNPAPMSTSSLAADFTTFRAFIMSALETLQKQVEFLGREMDRFEMQRRKKILLFHGIPEAKAESTTDTVCDTITSKLGLTEVTSASISHSYRLGRVSDKKARPVLIKFRESFIRNKVWFSKTKLKDTGITVSEFLTKPRHAVFLEARKRFGITKCWTRDGIIHVLAPDGNQYRVENAAEFEDIPNIPTTSAQQLSNTVKPGDKHALRSKRITRK